MNASVQSAPAFEGWRRRMADGCYMALKLAGWSVVTASCVVAIYVSFLALLGSFTPLGFAMQADNLAYRYVQAGGTRRDEFDLLLVCASAGLFGLVGVCRRHSLFPLIKKEFDNDQ